MSIYQIDAFHSLHCLVFSPHFPSDFVSFQSQSINPCKFLQYRIRNRLISELPIAEWPRDDEHTLHCLDYIREQLMCHGDVLLEGTDDYISFKKNHGHQCRDFDAIQGWALAHNWPGHREFLATVVGWNPLNLEHDFVVDHQMKHKHD